MNHENIKLYAYELGFKGESNIELGPEELQELRQIILCKDNFTYSELESLDAEIVEVIYLVIQNYDRGLEFKQKTQTKN